jgi:succinate dehydrogenase / fumarate reductase, cytochrome b subunit
MSHTTGSFFGRHEFLIRRLHSLSGLVPVGAYMTVHLLVNSSLVNGPGAFQDNVNQIHSLGAFLPAVEWAFIFLPIIFHAAFGVWIIKSGKSNVDRYRYTSNFRYAMQRWTGVIAVVFIFFHVFHLHGWFHSDYWLNLVTPWGMASFRPYNAASTLAVALSGFLWPIFYLLGVLACVYHFANGVWTAGITWGIWISPKAQRWATYACTAGGLGLAMVGLTALYAATQIDPEAAQRIEDNIYNSRVSDDPNKANEHKRSHPKKAAEDEAKSKDEASE